MIMKIFEVKDYWEKEAMDAAIKRREYHAAFGSKRHWYDPTKGEYTDEYYGNLGHIAFRESIKKIGLEKYSKFAPLFVSDLGELPEWDALVLNQKIEIKTVPPDTNVKRKRLLVKVSEFKNLDMYVAIKFWSKSTYSFCGFATGSEILSAESRNFGFALAYWMFLDNLPHRVYILEGESND